MKEAVSAAVDSAAAAASCMLCALRILDCSADGIERVLTSLHIKQQTITDHQHPVCKATFWRPERWAQNKASCGAEKNTAEQPSSLHAFRNHLGRKLLTQPSHIPPDISKARARCR